MTILELQTVTENLGRRIAKADFGHDITYVLEEWAPLYGSDRKLCHNGEIEAVIGKEDFRECFMDAILPILKKNEEEFVKGFSDSLAGSVYIRKE